jgi:hypothetical protein
MNSYQSTPVRLPGTPGFHQSWTRKEKDGDFSEHLTGKTKEVLSPACNGTSLNVDTGTVFDSEHSKLGVRIARAALCGKHHSPHSPGSDHG